MTTSGTLLDPNVIAQSNITHGVTVSPYFAEIVAHPDQTTTTKFLLYNGNNETLYLHTSIQPLDSLRAAAQQFSPKDDPALLASMSLGTDTLAIPPQTVQTVELTTRATPALRPGSHYAVLTFSASNDSTLGSNTLGINKNINALLFVVNDTGNLTRTITIDHLTFSGIHFAIPHTVAIPFTNTGTVHVRPYGEILVKKDSTTYAQGIINEDSRILLPETTNTWDVPMTGRATSWMPGTYTVEVRYHPDSADPTTYTTSMFIIPWTFIISLLALVILLRFVRVRTKRRG